MADRSLELLRDPRVRRLFATAPERFVAARNALAAELTSAGELERAAAVRALKRPTRRVWILNRLGRARPADVAALVDAGMDLKRAHAAAVRGDAADLRPADQQMSRRLDALVAEARKIAETEGHPADHALLVGVRGDLRNLATADAAAAERLRAGTLEEVPAPDVEEAFEGPPSLRGGRRAQAARTTTRAPRDTARERKDAAAAAEARTRVRDAERGLARAERELERRSRDVQRAEAAAGEAARRAAEARSALQDARARLADARRGATGSRSRRADRIARRGPLALRG